MKKRKVMSRIKKTAVLGGTAMLLLGCIGMLAGQTSSEFLKGNVIVLDQAAPSLAAKLDRARKEFSRDKNGAAYFTGYRFNCRHSVHYGDKEAIAVPYRVNVDENHIKIRHRTSPKKGTSHSMESDEGGEPAALLLLYKRTSRSSVIVDTRLLDIDQIYHFDSVPVFWLGDVDTGESMDFLTGRFAGADENVKEDLVFCVSAHADARVPEWLKHTALSSHSPDVREQAIFWRGNIDDKKCLADLMEIYRSVHNDKLREKVIFSLHICKDPNAVAEIIRIAKTETDEGIRKQAIFWLGQKASDAAVETLTDVVNGSLENTEIKKSAVFAISQLPDDRSLPLLMDIARTHKNPEIRKNAIFWLGESGDTRAVAFFEEILSKK